MASPVKPDPEPVDERKTVRFPRSDWKLVEDAAAALSAEVGVAISPIELVRSSAVRRAKEILGQAA